MLARDRLSWLVVSVALVAGAGCQRSRAPESFVPADSAFVVSVPRVEQALGAYKAFSGRFADMLAVRNALLKGEAKVMRETGVDLDRPDSISAKGIDTQQGIYLFMPATVDRGCVVSAVQNRDAAEGFVREVLRKLSDKPLTFRQTDARGLTVTEVLEEGQTQADTAMVHYRKSLLICAGSNKVNVADYLAGVVQTQSEQLIWDRPAFQAARAAAGASELWVYVDVGAARKWVAEGTKSTLGDSAATLLSQLQGRNAFAVGLELSAQSAALRLFENSSDERNKEDRQLATGQGAAPNFIQFLPMSGVHLLAKFSVNIPTMLERIMQLGAESLGSEVLNQRLAQANQQLGMDVKQDVFGAFAGRFLLGFDQLDVGLAEALQARDPMVLVPKLPAYLLAQVGDRAKAAKLLTALEARLRQAEVPLQVSGSPDPVYTISISGRPVLSLGLRGDMLLVSTAGHFPKLIEHATGRQGARAAVGSKEVATALQAADSQLFYVDFGQTAALLRAANLLKPDKDVEQALPLLDKLRDLAMLLQWQKGGPVVELQLRLR